MRKVSLIRLGLVATLTMSLAVFGGCFFDGEGGEDLPADVEQAVQDAESELAQGVSGLSLDMTTDALESLIQWSEGPPPPLREESVYYDADDQAWIIAYSEDFVEDDVSGHVEASWWLQFRAGETAQQEPNETTDQIELRFAATQAGNYHPTEHDWNVDFTQQAEAHLLATRQEDNSATIVGGGEIQGTSVLHIADRAFEHAQAVTWEYDLEAAPDAACVSGELVGSMQLSGRAHRAYTFGATFDGLGGIAWTVWQDEQIVDQDQRTYDCGQGQ
jgi:hypothetical protein